jgi:predicted secreted protein
MAETTVKGANVLIYADGVLVGGQRGCNLKITADTIDASDKTTDGWKVKLAGLREWSIDVDAVLKRGNAGFSALKTAILNGTSIVAKLSIDNDAETFTGNALVVDFDMGAEHEDVGTAKFSLVGASPLVAA